MAWLLPPRGPRVARFDLDGHVFWLQQDLPLDLDRLIGWELDVTLPVRTGTGQQLDCNAIRRRPAAEFIA